MEGNPELQRLASSSLFKIGGGLRINEAYALRDVSLLSLTDVQDISILHAPELDTVELAEAGVTVSSIEVSDTWLRYLRFDLDSIATMEINNNSRLTQFIGRFRDTYAGRLTFTSNSGDLFIDFSDLVGTSALVVNDTSGIHIPSLQSVNSSLEFGHNTFDSLFIPLLKSVGGTFSIKNNTELTRVDFPKLETINGSLAVVNNSAIVDLGGFPELGHVSEQVTIDGDFLYIELHSLTTATYGLLVSSSKNITFSCAALEKIFHSERPHQKFECRGAGDTVQDNTGNGNESTIPSQGEEVNPSNGALSGEAIAGIVVGALVGIAIVAAVFFIMGKRRRQRSEGPSSVANGGNSSESKHSHSHPHQPELQGPPRSGLASTVPEVAGSWSPKDTVYYEVDGSAPQGRL